MDLATWMNAGWLASGVVAIATAQSPIDEPIRPGGIELSYLAEEGLGELPSSNEATGPISAEARARAFVRDHPGLRVGWHHIGTDDEYVVVVASQAIVQGADGPYGDVRAIAFELARARAGLELAAMAGSRIEVEAEGIASEAGMTTNELLELVASRFSRGDVAGSVKDLDASRRVAVEEFSSRVARTCDEMIAGLQVFKAFEGPEDIAIVATWSRATRDLVDALRAPDASVRGKAAQAAIADWAAAIGDELLYSHGCHLRTDEHGELGVVAFGQADMAGSSRLFRDVAKAQASLAADVALSRFVNELIASSQGRGLASIALASGYGDGSVSLSELQSSYREQLRFASAMPDLPSATEVEVREILHPRNGENGAKTVCVVKHLSISSLHAQERMHRWMKNQAAAGDASASGAGAADDGDSVSGEAGDSPGSEPSGGQGVTGETP